LVALAVVFYFGSILVINALQMVSLVLLPFSQKAFRSVNRKFAELWWGWCVLGAEKISGIQPVFSGDEIPPGENAVVFANHQQMADILAIMMFAWRKKAPRGYEVVCKRSDQVPPGDWLGNAFSRLHFCEAGLVGR
jgi:1-acyl-sn-glycerol-3-phosphate acyltransferase